MRVGGDGLGRERALAFNVRERGSRAMRRSVRFRWMVTRNMRHKVRHSLSISRHFEESVFNARIGKDM